MVLEAMGGCSEVEVVSWEAEVKAGAVMDLADREGTEAEAALLVAAEAVVVVEMGSGRLRYTLPRLHFQRGNNPEHSPVALPKWRMGSSHCTGGPPQVQIDHWMRKFERQTLAGRPR